MFLAALNSFLSTGSKKKKLYWQKLKKKKNRVGWFYTWLVEWGQTNSCFSLGLADFTGMRSQDESPVI